VSRVALFGDLSRFVLFNIRPSLDKNFVSVQQSCYQVLILAVLLLPIVQYLYLTKLQTSVFIRCQR